MILENKPIFDRCLYSALAVSIIGAVEGSPLQVGVQSHGLEFPIDSCSY